MDLKNLIQSNYFAYIKPLLRDNFHIDKETNKIKRNVLIPDIHTPWIMHTSECGMNCIKWHTILFPSFGVLPKECMDCYKVVIRPKNIVELLKLKEIQDNLPDDIQCKCGIESLRQFVEAAYGGYFYNKLGGLEAGLDLLDAVRIMLKDRVEGDIFLKRACTEYERQFGPSNEWVYDPREADYSKWIDDNFHKNCFINPRLPDYARQDVVSRWIDFAAFIGDMSYLELTNGEHLHPTAIRYERG